MSRSCNLICRRRDKNTGKLTSRLSQLHLDLLNIGKNNKLFDRDKANRALFLSLSNKFLKEYDSELIFDSDAADAEPILASFYEVAKSIMPEVTVGDIRNLLAKKFGEGVYSYEEAFDKMVSFNKEMQGAHTFMGTIKRQSDGKYRFEVTYNAIDAQLALILTIADKNFVDIVTKKLNALGIAVEEGDSSFYSTERYNRLANGLLGIVRIKNGENVTTDLAKETGHAIIGTLGVNHPLVKRLMEIAEKNPEILAEIVGEEEWQKIGLLPKEKRTRELVGHAVGKYLEDYKISLAGIKAGIKRLIDRMLDYIKTKFAFTDRDYKQAQYDAKYLSYKAARDFMGPNFIGTLDNALNTQETLNAESNKLQGNLAEVLLRLDLLADRAKDWGFATAKAYKDKFTEIMSKYHEIGRQIKENKETVGEIKDTDILLETIKLLMLATRFIVNQVKDAQVLLTMAMSGIDPLSGDPINENEICKVIRKNEVLFTELNNLAKQWKEILDAYTSGEQDVREEIAELRTAINTSLMGIPTENASSTAIEENGYESMIHEARRKLATKLLTRINGNLFLIIELHVSMLGWRKIKRHKGTLIDLEAELRETDICPPLDSFSRYISAMADSPSIINQLMAQAVEEQKHKANVLTLNAKDRLFDLYLKMRSYGIKDTRIFMEKDDEGDYTGNIISERNWGEWEKRRKAAYIEWRDKWWNNNKHLFANKNEAYRDVQFLEAKGSFLKGWHNKNSSRIPLVDNTGKTRVDEEGAVIMCWAPAIEDDPENEGKILYDNEEYRDLKYSREEKDLLAYLWLQEYMQLKRELDALLPSGATNGFGVRAPQFLGTLTDKLHGAFGSKFSGQHIKRVGKTTLSHFVILNFAENPSDTEYGGEHNTYGDEEVEDGNDLIFTPAHINTLNSYRRVPLYGVRKLKDLHIISTDLIHSTLAYAAMAYNYSCLESIIDEVEVLKDLLRELKPKAISDKTIALLLKEGKPAPGYYMRMQDYMELQVYNVYAPLEDKKTYRFLRKGVGVLSRLGSLYFLLFNVHSAITNTLTGLWEIVKESIGGEDFTFGDFLSAFWLFNLWMAKATANNFMNWAQGFTKDGGHKGSSIESLDKMNLFLRMFDVQNENQRKFRDYHIETPGYQFFRGYSYANLAMLPYTITDKWMLTMAYIATAHHTKLINKNNEVSSIWDAYEVKDNKLVLKTLKDDEGNEIDAEWKILDKNQQKINETYKKLIENDTVPTNRAAAVYEFEDDELKFDADGKKIVKSIYVPWDDKALTLFKTKCRGINNRMHGVYNANDGGAFLGKLMGPAFASLKKYAIGLIDRRFSRGRYDARSRIWRQGSTITIANLFVDYMSSSDADGDTSHAIFDIKEHSERFLLGWKATNFVLGFLWAGIITLTGSAGTAGILRRRGYSEHLIANIRRFWADQAIPEMLKILLYIVAPPDERAKTQNSLVIWASQKVGLLNERENLEYDEDPWLPGLSELMLKGYLKALNWVPGKEHILGLNGELSEDDESILTGDYFYDLAAKYEKTIPFSIKGILYYLIYRTLIEQDAYNMSSPVSLYNLYSEYKNLTNSSIMGFSALYDAAQLLTLLAEHKTDEDLEEIAEKKGSYEIFDSYSEDGMKIYTKGVHSGFKKAAVHAMKVGPLRTPMTWLYGNTSKRNLAFWRSRALGLEEPTE